jgi:hypothetical protein
MASAIDDWRPKIRAGAGCPLEPTFDCVDSGSMVKLIVALSLALAALNSCIHMPLSPKFGTEQIELR